MKKKMNIIWSLLCAVVFVGMAISSLYFVVRVHSLESFLLLGLTLVLGLWFFFFTIPIESRCKKGNEGKGWMK